MPTFVPTLQATAGGISDVSAPYSRAIRSGNQPEKAVREREHLISAILTTSICLHLLFVGYLGFGVPASAPRLRVVRSAPPPPAIVENVQLEAPPPAKALREVLRDPPPPTAQDLPAPVAAIAAVPADLAVAFGIKVVGPVRLVSELSEAGGGSVATPLPSVPRDVAGRNLLTPDLVYPAEALYRRYTGKVVVEFRATAQGDIVAARIRSSSGYEILDRAALENLRLGRWVGEAGFFAKTYEFVLR